MLALSNILLNKPVFSLRSGTSIAEVVGLIINPENLKIVGLYCRDQRKEVLILLPQDIRETNSRGYFINDHDDLSKAEDLVRLKKIIDLNFNPIGKSVVTESGSKIGKVSDFAVEIESMYILKLYVGQSLIKSFTGGSLIVDRNQIIEITPKKIIVDDILAKNVVAAEAQAV